MKFRNLLLGLIVPLMLETGLFLRDEPVMAESYYEAGVSEVENYDDHGILFWGTVMGAAAVIGAILGADRGRG